MARELAAAACDDDDDDDDDDELAAAACTPRPSGTSHSMRWTSCTACDGRVAQRLHGCMRPSASSTAYSCTGQRGLRPLAERPAGRGRWHAWAMAACAGVGIPRYKVAVDRIVDRTLSPSAFTAFITVFLFADGCNVKAQQVGHSLFEDGSAPYI